MFCRLEIARIGAISWRLLFFDDIAVAVILTVPSSIESRGSSLSPGNVAIRVPFPLSILTTQVFRSPWNFALAHRTYRTSDGDVLRVKVTAA